MNPAMIKIGQIVPSSNLTMEREIPAMLRARETVLPARFSFHSSRMRMKRVTQEELASMDRDSDRCALELAAGVPVLSAAVATTYEMLSALGLETRVPNAGHLLSGAFPLLAAPNTAAVAAT